MYCPNCLIHVNSVVAPDRYERPPKNGDIMVCVHCQHVLLYEDGELSLMDDTEIGHMPRKLRYDIQRMQLDAGQFMMENKAHLLVVN